MFSAPGPRSPPVGRSITSQSDFRIAGRSTHPLAQSTVSLDQSTVSLDQSTVSLAQSTVSLDQSTVSRAQSTVSGSVYGLWLSLLSLAQFTVSLAQSVSLFFWLSLSLSPEETLSMFHRRPGLQTRV